jgi:3-dehydroquinate dehydratase-2
LFAYPNTATNTIQQRPYKKIAMTKTLYVLNGPNLNLLGTREPHIYGTTTLAEIESRLKTLSDAQGLSLIFRQSNHEGHLVDWIQEAATKACALIINPAAYGHTSVALLDALKALEIPIIECHLSNPQRRETFRHHSYVSLAASGIVAGFGAKGYELAFEAALSLIDSASKSA